MQSKKDRIVIINPNHMDQINQSILNALISQSPSDCHIWQETEVYSAVVDGENYIVVFEEGMMIKRNRSQSPEVRYELIDLKSLGQGAFGVVYPVTCTIAIDATGIHIKQKPIGKRRVVKVSYDQSLERRQRLDREYCFLVQTAQSHAKPFVFVQDKGYLVQRRQEGVALLNLLADDRYKAKRLTLKQRITLSLNLLRAVEEQVSAKNIIHRDIKPENIIVDSALNCTIIDYGLAKWADEVVTNEGVGTLSYISPEAMLNNTTTIASDIFSLSRVFRMLWGDSLSPYRQINDAKLPMAIRVQYALDYAWREDVSEVGSALPEIDKAVIPQIQSIIYGMARYDPALRSNYPQIRTALLELEALVNNLTDAPSPPPQRDTPCLIEAGQDDEPDAEAAPSMPPPRIQLPAQPDIARSPDSSSPREADSPRHGVSPCRLLLAAIGLFKSLKPSSGSGSTSKSPRKGK